MDVVGAVDTRLQQVQMILDSGFADPSLRVSTTVLVIPEADTVLLLLRQLPQSVALHIQLHGTAGTYANVCDTVRCYDLNTRLLDVSKIHSFQGPPFGKGGKGKGNGKKGISVYLMSVFAFHVELLVCNTSFLCHPSVHCGSYYCGCRW